MQLPVLRLILLALTILSLVMNAVGLFVTVLESKENTLAYEVDGVLFEPNSGAEGSPIHSKMTLWKVDSTFVESDTLTFYETMSLRKEFFTCPTGRKSIQAAEGTAVVAFVLCCANLFMAIFMFRLPSVLKFPLSLYSLLAAAATSAVLGIMVNYYTQGWCGWVSPKGEGWHLASGGVTMIFSMIFSFGAAIVSLLV